MQLHIVSALWDVFMLRTLVLSSTDTKYQHVTGIDMRHSREK